MLILLAFSKAVRDHEGQKEKGPPRNLAEETTEMKSLSKKHETKTFPGYCLPSSIQGEEFYAILLEAVEELNWIKRLAQKALLFLMERCAADNCLDLLHPATHGSTVGNGGVQFFQQLLSIIRNEKLKSNANPLSVFTKYLDELKPFFLNKIGKHICFLTIYRNIQ